MKKSTWFWLLAPAAALGAAGFLFNTNPPTNRAQTSPDAADPQLKTRVYSRPLNEVLDEVHPLIGSLRTYGRSWQKISVNGLLVLDKRKVYVDVPVLFFTDNLTISLEAEGGKSAPFGGGETTVVNVESRSNVGQGDFGENRRHIIQFLTALDEKLK